MVKANEKLKTHREIVRVEGKLKEIVTVRDEQDNVLHKIISPLMVEFSSRDILEVLVGASILAIPVGYTEESWRMGETLPLLNIAGFLILSLLFIATFDYYAYYKTHLTEHKGEFIKRILFTYALSFIIVGIILTLIDKAPWADQWLLAFKRTVLVTFPASMSAAVVDTIK